jgi:UDP-GlcNAc:undecaprenyl-phosphate/decaprenyl-phosphate GlcNAc-1-phosphate transferase
MIAYLISFIILSFSLLAYFKIADKYNIIDKPNQRSSHTKVTIRGGGIIFSLAAILWFFFYGFQQPYLIFSLLAIATISFLDDVMVLSKKIRIAIHFLAVGIMFWQLGVLNLPWYLLFACFIITIGWINAFNFMDGINGITASYSIVALATLLWLAQTSNVLAIPYASELLVLLILSVVIFSFFNFRKRAKCFAGDIGSVGMAFLISWLLLYIILHTARIEYLLFVSVYGIDSVITILYRLKRRENIFEAHRTHLYQYMSNELKVPHVVVSICYGITQLLINILTIFLILKGMMSIQLFAVFLVFLSSIYIFTRNYVVKLAVIRS